MRPVAKEPRWANNVGVRASHGEVTKGIDEA